jgi:hydrogenase-4 component B
VQHNLKKLLAYHSIENIGIIGIGIGIGCIGLGSGNQLLASLGFAGALLHTLNHALFKSLLFYTAGNVYQATHTLHIEHLGGVMKKMPQTAILFLIAAIAICGIPPFNGFISEFLIYIGLYNWLQHATLVSLVVIVFSIVGLVLIGGLALFCFTKAFGIVFLGNPRKEFTHEVKEVPFTQLAPLYLIAFFIVLIGSFPNLFLHYLSRPVGLFTGAPEVAAPPLFENITGIMQPVAWAAWGVILLTFLLWGIRKMVTKNRKLETSSPTWSCGYVAPTSKLQYTASSFVRSYTKLYKAIFIFSKKEKEIEEIFPTGGHYESHAYDKIEKYLIDKPVEAYQWLMGRFLFLQNGKLQVYILYGIIFILSVICLPLLFGKFSDLLEFLKQL